MKKQNRLCGMKVSDEIFEGVQNHLVLGLDSKNDLMLLRLCDYQLIFCLCCLSGPVLNTLHELYNIPQP